MLIEIRTIFFIEEHNSYVSCVLVVVDFCAEMAVGHAQKGAKTETSTGHIC